jgi:SAM-dependent methyltransferase
MERVETIVVEHYGSGRVMQGIVDAVERAGMARDRVTERDLMPVDEFHTGGVEATEALLAQLGITAGTRVLDMGSGIGGPARLIAERYRARVVGVDLTPEYVRTAEELSALVGLDALTRFVQGSVTALPVEAGSADLALLLHVGMNVPDKPAIFREAARALAPGGVFALFEVMRGPEASPLTFPLPWAATEGSSFVAPPDEYRAAAAAAGFRLRHERDRSGFAVDFFGRLFERVAREGPPVLGLHLLMGDDGREKLGNLFRGIEAGRLAPVEMIFDRA